MEKAFAGSNVEVVFLPDGLEEIQNKAFESCHKLRQINFPEGLKRLGRWSFQGCHSLLALALPESLEIIDGYAFDECSSLTEVQMPKQMHNIGAYAFAETSISHIKIPEGIKCLSNSLFYGCTNLEFVEMPEGITEILNMTFAECSSLDNIFLPKSLKKIGLQAFQNCINLKTITVAGKIEQIAESAFIGCENLVSVISALKRDYKVEILDPQFEMLQSFMKNMNRNDYEREFNTKFKKSLIENLINDGNPVFSRSNRFWRFMPLKQLQNFRESKKAAIYQSLGIETKQPLGHTEEKKEETILVEGLSNYIEEDLTEKDLYNETLLEGIELTRRGDIEGAIAKYKEAIKFKPMISTAYYNLGKTLYIRQDYKASVRSYKMALQLGQDRYEVLRHMGHSLLDEKMIETEYKDAIQQYEEGINPFLTAQRMLSGTSKFTTVSKERADEYDNICISSAEEYLQQDLGEQL